MCAQPAFRRLDPAHTLSAFARYASKPEAQPPTHPPLRNAHMLTTVPHTRSHTPPTCPPSSLSSVLHHTALPHLLLYHAYALGRSVALHSADHLHRLPLRRARQHPPAASPSPNPSPTSSCHASPGHLRRDPHVHIHELVLRPVERVQPPPHEPCPPAPPLPLPPPLPRQSRLLRRPRRSRIQHQQAVAVAVAGARAAAAAANAATAGASGATAARMRRGGCSSRGGGCGWWRGGGGGGGVAAALYADDGTAVTLVLWRVKGRREGGRLGG